MISEIIYSVKRMRVLTCIRAVINRCTDYANSYRAHNPSNIRVIMELITSDSLGFNSFIPDRRNCFFNAIYQPYIGL